MNKAKFHYISDQLADLVLKNNSCAFLTPQLIKEGVFSFDKRGGKDFYGTLFGSTIRLSFRKGYQGASEGNNNIGVLACRELFVNADEALLELDYALSDEQDYNKVLKGDKSKYQISSMIDAQNKFPVSETLSNVHQKRINAVLVEGSNENLRGLCVQDSGIGQCGDSFEGNFTYSNRHSTKGGINFLTGLYGMGSTAITQFQSHETLRYRTAFSRRHHKFVEPYELEHNFGKHIHFAFNLILIPDLFEDGGVLSELDCPTLDRGYNFYSLEIEVANGVFKHPICSENYKFSPSYSDTSAKKNCKGLEHGTLVMVSDVDIHRDSNKVCNVQSKTKFYDSAGINALAAALNSTHPYYLNTIGLDDQIHKKARAKTPSDKSRGGVSRLIEGLEQIMARDGYESIDFGEFNMNLFGSLERIKVLGYFDNRDVTEDYRQNTAMNGCSFKLGDFYASFDSLTKIRTKYKIQKPLCDLMKFIFDFNGCSEKTKRKLTQSSRNNLNLDKSERDELTERGIDLIHNHSRMKELFAEYPSASNDKLDSFKEEDFDLLSPLFLGNCKTEAPKPKPNLNATYDRELKYIQIKPTTLRRKLFNNEKVSFKCIGSDSSSFNLSFIHNVYGSVADKHRFDIDISMSLDQGKTWNNAVSNTPICDKDGELEIKGITSPNQNDLDCADKTFLMKVSIKPRNQDKWVSSDFVSAPIDVRCIFNEPQNINHSDQPRNRTKFSFSSSGGTAPALCPLDVRIIKDAKQFYDAEGNLEYMISYSDVDDQTKINPMKENDFVGFSNSHDKQTIVLNGIHQELSSRFPDDIEREFATNYLASKLKSVCAEIISNQNEVTDLSAINSSFPAEIGMAFLLIDKSIKQAVQARREVANKKNKRKAKSKKLSSKKKPLAKKKSKQSA